MKPAYAVIDTNVLVSGIMSPNGHPGRIVELLRSGDVKAVVDDRITREYVTVLKRPEFCFPEDEIDIFIGTVLKLALHSVVKKENIINKFPDLGDIPFAECALSFECPIVTGNKKHFISKKLEKIRILSPAEFIDYLIDQL